MHVPFGGRGRGDRGAPGRNGGLPDGFHLGGDRQVQGNKAARARGERRQRRRRCPVCPRSPRRGVRGYVTNFTGLWAPKGTPADVLARLQKEVATAMATPDMRTYAESIGGDAGGWDARAFRKEMGGSHGILG